MKLSRIITPVCASAALFFTACDKKESAGSGAAGGAVSEKAALDAFKKSAEELNALTKEEPNADPMAGMAKMKTVMARVNAIKTDGLPADLKEAFTGFRSKLSEMVGLLKDMPEKKEDMLAWAQKMAADPALGAKMAAIGQEVGVLGEKLSEVAKKHGIDAQMGK